MAAESGASLLHCICRLLALLRHRMSADRLPLARAIRTWSRHRRMTESDRPCVKTLRRHDRQSQSFLLEGRADDVDDLLDVRQRIEPSSKMFEAINGTRSKQSAYVRIEFAFDAFCIDRIFRAATAMQDFARECPAVGPLDGDPGCMAKRWPFAFDLRVNRNLDTWHQSEDLRIRNGLL